MTSATPFRIALLGVTGRMGKALVTVIDEDVSCAVCGGTASEQSRWLGLDIGEATSSGMRGVAVTSDPAIALGGAQVAIDFSLPEASARNLAAAVQLQRPLVIGTTGLNAEVHAAIRSAARHIPILVAANMSLGVNLLLRLTELAARALDADYDIEISEAHHRHKKDSPSGTALALGAAVAKGRDIALDEAGVFSRHGTVGARQRGTVGFSVIRGGDIIGDHSVIFAGTGERIELQHKASDRLCFARGALQAARWLAQKPAGLYSMADVLGLGDTVPR